MSANLTLLSPEACLISELTKKLASLSNKELSELSLILPTGRLATFLLAKLAKEKTAFFPPKIMTLDSFISEFDDTSELSVLSDNACDILLSKYIEDADFEQISKGHEREIRLFLGELFDCDIDLESAFSEIDRILTEDIYKNDEHQGSLYTRYKEMKTCCEFLLRFLEENSFELAKQKKARKAKNASQRISEGNKHWDKLWVAGITSITRNQHPIFASLANDNSVEIIASLDKEMIESEYPSYDYLKSAFSKDMLLSLASEEHDKSDKNIKIVNSSTLYSEVAICIGKVKELITKGTNAAKIAILATSERDYGPLLENLSELLELDANNATSKSLSSSSSGLWLKLFLNYLEKRENPRTKVEFLTHPKTLEYMADLKHSQSDIRTFIEDLAKDEIKDGQHKIFEDLDKLFTSFKKDTQSLNSWLNEISTIVEKFELFTDKRDDLEDNALDAYEAFQREMMLCHKVSPQNYDLKELLTLTKKHLLSAEIRTKGEPLNGVQIVSLDEARHYPFEHVFILGCNEGSFPKPLPKDELVDNYLKLQIDLPGWEYLEKMEDQTFYMLERRLPYLYLCRSDFKDSEPQTKSRFIEKVSIDYDIKSFQFDFNGSSFWSDENNYDTSDNQREFLNEGQINIDESLWNGFSQSSLSKLLCCPYRFFLYKQNLQKVEVKDTTENNKAMGTYLHKVLEVFFLGSKEGFDLEPLELQDDFYSYALSRLKEITHALAPKGFVETPLYYQLINYSWPKFIDHVKKMYPDKKGKVIRAKRELEFAKGTTIRMREREREFYGSIDAVDFSNDSVSPAFVTDYKLKGIPQPSGFKAGYEPQLAIYAMVLDKMKLASLDSMICGYWSIQKGTWKAHSKGEGMDIKGLTTRATDHVRSLIDNMLAVWDWREESVLKEKRYYADPSQCGFCDYKDMCRLEDPLSKERIEAQSKLTDMLKER